MRGVLRVAVVALAVFLAGSAGAAHLGSRSIVAAHPTKLRLPLPPPGRLVFGAVKIHDVGEAAIADSKKPFVIRLTNGGAFPGAVLVAGVHTQRTRKGATRTIVYVLANTGRRAVKLANAPHDRPPPDFAQMVWVAVLSWQAEENTLKNRLVYTTVLPPGGDRPTTRRIEEVSTSVAPGENAAAPKIASGFDKLLNDPDAWKPANDWSADPSIDLSWLDDAHPYGWKMQSREILGEWGKLTQSPNLDDLIARIEADLAKDGPPAPLDPTKYSCVGQQVKLFDNWNGVSTRPGASIEPTFDTGDKAYCLDMVATYHWNNGKGAPPGTIGLVGGGQKLGPWKAEGTDGQNGVHNANWVATVPAGTIIQGSYRCTDSQHSTWATNDDAHGIGFCRVWAREAQKTG